MDEVAAFAHVPFKEVGTFCNPTLHVLSCFFHFYSMQFVFMTAYSVQVDIAIPEVFVGGLLGSMLIFLFSAWACAAVGRTAQEVVNEVRRQFIERPGIMVSPSISGDLYIAQ